MISYLQAVVIGVLQGVTELFPISSLGHSVLVPALIGGSWAHLVSQESSSESPYLAFLVGLHVATAIALLVFFWRDWVRIVTGLLTSIRDRRVVSSDQKLAWLIIVATIPVGIIGLLAEHSLRTLFAKPLASSIFLTVNGLILLTGERLRRRDETRRLAGTSSAPAAAGARRDATGGVTEAEPVLSAGRRGRSREQGRVVSTLTTTEAVGIGVAQSAALLAGISRSGITMVAGLFRGLSHEDAARFSFLLATPVILLAGVYKLPDLLGHNGNGVRGQVLVGSVVAGLAAYGSVRFLTRYFQTRTLTPFAVYSLVAGALCVVRFGFF